MTNAAPATSHTVAFLDFGTNSVRLLVVRVDPNNSYTIVQKLKETIRLGEGEFGDGRLQPGAIDRAVETATRFAQTARAAGAGELVAVGTAAAREAANSDELVKRLRDEAGVSLRIVSGQEEARLIYLGVSSGMQLGNQQAFFMDIGGGSTETIVGTQQEHLYLHSLKLGAIRLSNLFLAGDNGPVAPETYEQLCTYIRRSASTTLKEIAQFRLDLAIGSSGTIESLAEVAARMKDAGSRSWRFTYPDLQSAIRMLCERSLDERRALPGLNPNRADIVIGGAAIVDVFMEELGLTEMRVSDRGLRDGLLIDYLTRHQTFDLFSGVALRERSVLQLGRVCRFNEEHARTTAELALQLFDSARECGLHSLGEWERELLEYAALLHHIGSFLTYSGYQRHSYYLVRNADLLGFDQLEIALIARAVLYHRGTLPRKGAPELNDLPNGTQETMRLLSTFIRMAENLDRTQSRNVTAARLRPGRRRGVILELEAAKDPTVELSGIENQRAAIEKVLRASMRVEVTLA